MEEKYLKLENLMKEDGKIEEIFSGTAEEILAKLASNDIELTMDELNDIKEGFNEVMSASSDELFEESLEDVAGGCKTCSNAGYEFGKNVANFLRKVKNFVCFWNW